MAAQKASVSGRPSLGLAGKVTSNECGSAKPHSLLGSEQADTVKDFPALAFSFYYFQKLLPQHPGPRGRESTNPMHRSVLSLDVCYRWTFLEMIWEKMAN